MKKAKKSISIILLLFLICLLLIHSLTLDSFSHSYVNYDDKVYTINHKYVFYFEKSAPNGRFIGFCHGQFGSLGIAELYEMDGFEFVKVGYNTFLNDEEFDLLSLQFSKLSIYYKSEKTSESLGFSKDLNCSLNEILDKAQFAQDYEYVADIYLGFYDNDGILLKKCLYEANDEYYITCVNDDFTEDYYKISFDNDEKSIISKIS